jgi:hypothetical protein
MIRKSRTSTRTVRRVGIDRHDDSPPNRCCVLSLCGGSHGDCEGRRCYLFTPQETCAVVDILIDVKELVNGYVIGKM